MARDAIQSSGGTDAVPPWSAHTARAVVQSTDPRGDKLQQPDGGLPTWHSEARPSEETVLAHAPAIVAHCSRVLNADGSLRETDGGPMVIEQRDEATPTAVTDARPTLHAWREEIKAQLDELETRVRHVEWYQPMWQDKPTRVRWRNRRFARYRPLVETGAPPALVQPRAPAPAAAVGPPVLRRSDRARESTRRLTVRWGGTTCGCG